MSAPVAPISEWEINGWRLLIEQGRKHPDDRRIGVASPGGEFCVLSLASLGAIVHLWYRNEDVLYPPADGYLGGEKVLAFLADCCKHGVRDACADHKLREPAIRRLDAELPEAA